MAPLLSVRSLTTAFRGEKDWVPVIRDISFDVAANETVAIVGESGSGKSVTALSIMRLLPEKSSRMAGSVLFAGNDIAKLPAPALQKIRGNDIAMIFQEPMTSLNPVLTIGSQIAEALIYHRNLSPLDARAEAIGLLEKVRIPAAQSRFEDYPHRFSGGMRQRVMIAMALACKPKLLIADEPTTALDVTIQAQILDLIKVLQDEEQMAVLFITHDMGVVAEIADRTIVMYRGEIVENEPTPAIFTRPRHPYTKTLLAAVPRLGSMAAQSRPMRFPVIDPVSGAAVAPAETADTVVSSRKVLEIRDLITRFDIRSGVFGRLSGRVHAVEKVSFDLHAGETLALVGESGCGKSTVGRSILRLVRSTSGTVRIDGKDVLSLDKESLRALRKSAQMIFQDPLASLNPRMTIGAAIAEPLKIHGIARSIAAKTVAQLLDQVGLDARMAERYPHEFSGGQRQRICIARALALRPKLIVADESVSALDVSIKAQVVNLMLELQARLGLSYLFISHDMAVVERVSHRIAVMFLGEIVEIGPRAAVFGNPQHAYTRKLLSAVPVPDPQSRGKRRAVSNDEITSPVRSPDYVPPSRRYHEVAEGHFVLETGLAEHVT